MRTIVVLMALFARAAAAEPVGALDWNRFDDPKAFLLTDAFAKSIDGLPAPEKAAALKRLQGSLKSKEVEVRRRAALTLAGLGDKSGVPTLIEDLSTAQERDRLNVAIALRFLKDEQAIPAWRKSIRDKSPSVRGIAVAALGELKAGKAFEEIIALTKDKAGLEDGKVDGRLNCIRDCPAYSACYALGVLGDERAVPVLIELLADQDLRGPARRGLEVLSKQKFGDDPERWKAWWKSKER
jgi:HEAT repeat protein